jgi:hypothetical protein
MQEPISFKNVIKYFAILKNKTFQHFWCIEFVFFKFKRPFLLFAGEATHSKHFSTVHGAYFTGVRESDRILNSFSLK